MALIRDKIFSTIWLSHFAVDILNGQRSVLFVYLAVALGLSNAELGLFSAAYVFIGALLQPVFGYIADRGNFAWTIAGGTLWIGVFFTIGLIVPGFPGLVFFIIASLGSAAFHPAGTMQATLVGRARIAGRETTSSSYFFLAGQLGIFAGPLLGGFLLNASGQRGILWLTAFTMLVGIFGLSRLSGRDVHWEAQPKAESTESQAPPRRVLWIAFALLATSQSWAKQNVLIYLPKYLSDLGRTPEIYGMLSALFIGFAALGMLSGGIFADRYGKRITAATMLGLAVLPMALIPLYAATPWIYLVIPVAGYFAGSTHSIIVVLAQRYIPGGMARSSGLILGYIFSTSSIGVLLSGVLADAINLQAVFWLSAALVGLAAIMALSLDRN
jgi:FSR family fosmidomycin resistance protein-like MFS transporter